VHHKIIQVVNSNESNARPCAKVEHLFGEKAMAGVKVQTIIHVQVVNFDGGPAYAAGGVTRAVGRRRSASHTARTLGPELRGVSLDLACEADALARHGIAGAAVAPARQGRERMPVLPRPR
jgi:hypothetical protein